MMLNMSNKLNAALGIDVIKTRITFWSGKNFLGEHKHLSRENTTNHSFCEAQTFPWRTPPFPWEAHASFEKHNYFPHEHMGPCASSKKTQPFPQGLNGGKTFFDEFSIFGHAHIFFSFVVVCIHIRCFT